jgi:hypothetical protein
MQLSKPENLLPVSKEEWVQWKGGKCTQRLVHSLALKRAGMIEEWADGRCSSLDQEKIVQGHIQAYRDVIEYVLRDFDFISNGEEVEN